jgi:hypothetical protein
VTELCEHHYCRCVRAEELARLTDRTGDGRYLVEATQVHNLQVRCRLPPEHLTYIESPDRRGLVLGSSSAPALTNGRDTK